MQTKLSAIRTRFQPLLLGNALLALAYVLAGWLGEQFTIDPGNVSLFFVSAGISLAAIIAFGSRAIPGILLGSVSYNLWFFQRHEAGLSYLAFAASLAISLGSVLQALAGAKLVDLFIHRRNEKLLSTRVVCQSALLAGPLACLIASLCGATTLIACGYVPPERFVNVWFGWWVGDVLGVLLIVPVALMWQRGESDRARLWGVATIGIAMSLCLWNSLRENEQRTIGDFFRSEAAFRAEIVPRSFSRAVNFVAVTKSFFEASELVRAAEFTKFAQPLLENEPVFDAIKWIPRVTREQRTEHEARVQRDLGRDYVILDRDEQGQLFPAGARDVYFPIQYTESHSQQVWRGGFDVASVPGFKDVLQRACDSGRHAVTSLNNLDSPTTITNRLAIVFPLFSSGAIPSSRDERRDQLRGYIVGICWVDRLANHLFMHAQRDGFCFTLTDEMNQAHPLIWTCNSKRCTVENLAAARNSPPSNYPNAMTFHTTIPIADRKWTIWCRPTDAFVAQRRTWMPLISLLSCLAATGAVTWYLTVVCRQNSVVKELVEQRTAELSAAVEALHTEVAGHRETARHLEERNGASQAANKAKSDFLANMSHELRTPLTAIIGYAELLAGEHSAEEFREWLNTIRQNGQHLLALINDVLDLSKIEANRVQIERLPLSPERLAAEVFGLLKGRADEKGLALELVGHPSAPDEIQSDPTRLRQILVNLVGNAIKFTEHGVVRMEMQGTERSIDGVVTPCVEFSVTDTGIGMDQAQIDRLFQPFTQADMSTTREFGGTGLGLSISKRLAILLGGDIGVTSEPGCGSQFFIWLPVTPIVADVLDEVAERSPSVPRISSSTQEKSSGAETNSRTFDELAVSVRESAAITTHVLLAEDRPDNQRLISCLLRRAGAEVTIVENGRLAVERVHEAMFSARPFDLILMDMQMPEMDGYEATAQLRADGFNGTIVAITANALVGDRNRCLTAGCSDYLTKPIDAEQLLRVVRGASKTVANGSLA